MLHISLEHDDRRFRTRRICVRRGDDDHVTTARRGGGEHRCPGLAHPEWVRNDDDAARRREAVQHCSRDGGRLRPKACLVMYLKRVADVSSRCLRIG